MWDFIIALLHNTEADTWHPILFTPAPFPGMAGPPRYRSRAHHTKGFSTPGDAAVGAAFMSTQLNPIPRLDMDTVFEWDGVGVPAITHFFVPADHPIHAKG